MEIKRRTDSPSGPEIPLHIEDQGFPTFLLSLEQAAECHTRGRCGHRFALRVGPIGYVLGPLPGHPEPRVVDRRPVALA